MAGAAAYSPDAINVLVKMWEKVDEERNRPLTDEEFDATFLLLNKRDVPEHGLPFMEPKDYEYFGPLLNKEDKKDDVPEEIPDGLPFMEPKDYEYFGSSLNKEDEDALSPEERKIMKVLLELKNGTPNQMKIALRQLIDYAREFGGGPLLNRVLPLLMHPTLNNQERRLMVKVFSRVVYELDELVRPHAHRILVVIGSLLMDEDCEDCDVRAEGTEIIYNLSKAAGLNTMIDAFRPDTCSPDEYVRNATARSFGVAASALGVAALLPFVKEVCQSSKSWPARHTGFMIVHQIIIVIGAAVLPHERSLVDIIKLGLNDENKKVRTVATLALDALNKFAAHYGIKI